MCQATIGPLVMHQLTLCVPAQFLLPAFGTLQLCQAADVIVMVTGSLTGGIGDLG
ncbi:hypothetical protein D3C80_1953790 [compost metagenome]